ncbi:lysophospholipase-like protein 1 isoform X2 [Mya arenaria]|nr:lysophospholipase-like protein 1 isoform X2 [Mya arenaria]
MVLGMKQLTFPHLRILYPTAPPRPYTPMMGNLSTVWYDRSQISPNSPDNDTVGAMATQLAELVQCEVDLGIPLNRIIIGGFSMGGGMALHLGYKHLRGIAGVFAMSSFLSEQSTVYEALEKDNSGIPPLFMSHGEIDTLVDYSWGEATFRRLKELGVQGQFHRVPGLLHEMDNDTLTKLCAWITSLVPQSSAL